MIVLTHELHAREIPLFYIRAARIVLGRYTLRFEEYTADIVFLRCTGQVPVTSGVRVWCVYTRCAPASNKSINFFIVLVLHRGQNSNAASRRKRATAKRREWDPSSYTGLQLKSVKRVAGKLPGKQLAIYVLWLLHSHCFWSVCANDSLPKTFSRVVECLDIRLILISYRQRWWFHFYPWIWCTC